MAYTPGVFDILKGAYLSPGAVDKTLPTEVALNRGDLVVESGGKWIVATGGIKTANVYAVLTPTDKVASFAGSAFGKEGTTGAVGGLGIVNLRSGGVQAPIGTERADSAGSTIVAGNYVVTAYPLNVPGEFRISVASNSTLAVGDNLMAASGVFVDDTSDAGKFVVTGAATDVYHNNKTVKTDANGAILRQGGPVRTITFKYVA